MNPPGTSTNDSPSYGADGPICEVIVDLHVPDVDRIFHYAIPQELEGKIELGHRVMVPFGHRPRVEGYVIGFASESDHRKLKAVEALMDQEPLLTPAQIEVARWMREQYLCPLVQALQCFLPPGARMRGSRVARRITRLAVRVADRARVEAALCELRRRAPKQAAILERLLVAEGSVSFSELQKQMGAASTSVRALIEKGLAIAERVELQRGRMPAPATTRSLHTLNEAQQRALAAIVEALGQGKAKRFLLQGVTGSGKTEVYLQAMARVVEEGRGAILLVPEIALTPQTIAYFHSYFGDRVAVMHSRLSLGERYDEWWRIHRGEVSIVIGARSAVFAPVRNLALIILDEEHETSYKQEESPRYHAREVAWARACREGAALLLGSATPAIEVRTAAEAGKYAWLELPFRVHSRPLPKVEIVDMRDELIAGNRSMFSRLLAEKLEGTLRRQEQALLFMNRRGLASFLLCRECGFVPRCPLCEVSLTLHAPSTLRCHYCDHTTHLPAACPQCGSAYLRPFGGGTQRIEEEVRKAFPAARPVRMDVDTTARKGAHAQIIEAFSRGEYNVLIGTQMVAKGLHFPGVTLVGVVSADVGLNLPDFRAAERTFQILSQVAGRAGRGGRAGEVVIQTYAADHYAVQAAAAHDYDGFYRAELDFRRRAGYPPFVTLARCVWSGESEERVIAEALKSGQFLGEGPRGHGVQAVGPSPAPISRLKGRYRWHLVLKGERESLLAVARRIKALHEERGQSDVRLAVDIDPVGML